MARWRAPKVGDIVVPYSARCYAARVVRYVRRKGVRYAELQSCRNGRLRLCSIASLRSNFIAKPTAAQWDAAAEATCR